MAADGADASATDTFQKAVALYGAQRFDEAEALCIGILAVDPRSVAAKNLLGAIAMLRGDHARAAELFGEAAKLAPDAAELHVNRGDALQALNRPDAALKCYERALKCDPGNAEVRLKRAMALYGLEKTAAAEAALTDLLTLHPGMPDAWHARGLIRFALGRNEDALGDYDRALAVSPDRVDIHAARAETLEALDRRTDARAALEKTLALAPDRDDTREQLFSLHLSETTSSPELDRLAAAVAQTTATRDTAHLIHDRATFDFRLLHDLEQSAHLIARGITFDGLREAHAALTAAFARLGETPTGKSVSLTDAEIAAIAAARRVTIRHPVPRLPGSALNPAKDWTAIEDSYFSQRTERAVIDDFLSPEALAQLRDFALLSTIWRREYTNQYIGAFAQHGFVGPLHMQIAEELQHKMPRIFAQHRLHQLWGFKYASTRAAKGIGVHADFARVNLNFWITPDEANLDPTSGGMVIYDVPAPKTWGFKEYNVDHQRIYAFLKKNRATAQTVPHRSNRAVLFNSTLFHETDTIRFKEGYENRRVNVTYLFGRGLKM